MRRSSIGSTKPAFTCLATGQVYGSLPRRSSHDVCASEGGPGGPHTSIRLAAGLPYLLRPVPEISACRTGSRSIVARPADLRADAAAIANIARTRVVRPIVAGTGVHRLIGFRVVIFQIDLTALMISSGGRWIDVAQDAVCNAIVFGHR